MLGCIDPLTQPLQAWAQLNTTTHCRYRRARARDVGGVGGRIPLTIVSHTVYIPHEVSEQ